MPLKTDLKECNKQAVGRWRRVRAGAPVATVTGPAKCDSYDAGGMICIPSIRSRSGYSVGVRHDASIFDDVQLLQFIVCSIVQQEP